VCPVPALTEDPGDNAGVLRSKGASALRRHRNTNNEKSHPGRTLWPAPIVARPGGYEFDDSVVGISLVFRANAQERPLNWLDGVEAGRALQLTNEVVQWAAARSARVLSPVGHGPSKGRRARGLATCGSMCGAIC